MLGRRLWVGVAVLIVAGVAGAALAQQAASPPAADDTARKAYVGTWSGQEDRRLGLPAPKLKIKKDGTGAYFLSNPDKPLFEFKWSVGDEDQLQGKTEDERFFAAIIRPDGKLMWKQTKLPPGTNATAIEFEKVPSDF